MDEKLEKFLTSAKEHGLADDAVVMLLKQNGWPEREIYRSFSAYYVSLLGMAIPQRGDRSEHARDAFYYLLNFLTLGFWTIGLGKLFFALIDHWIPDPTLSFQQSLIDETSFPVATLIITFPVFVFIHRLIAGQLRNRPDLYESGIRKWLTYVALVIAAVVVLSDGIWFLQTFLRGEFTIRFALHSLLLLVIGGGVFSYYLLTINPPKTQE